MGEMFTIKLAGKSIGIAARNGYVREYCRDYLTEDKKRVYLHGNIATVTLKRWRCTVKLRTKCLTMTPYFSMALCSADHINHGIDTWRVRH